ncbi:MAG: D-alanyl-D-alanine carboxypeptidase (penicillin-binding protein 5/6) [Parcubacteria bacterium C7867-002]|nr:MAG: D-alanyl-D-alanine carboxypeptidase (penicillin-binding protein 5/6) [Parcubacteria bacterium C7867-002]
MSVPYRSTLIILFLCIGFITFAIGVKVHKTVVNNPLPVVKLIKPAPFVQTQTPHPLASDLPFSDFSTTTRITAIPEKPPVPATAAVADMVASQPGVSGVTARAYIAGNIETGEIYAEYRPTAVLPVASMSKLVTAFVATNELSLDRNVEITTETLNVPPDKSALKEGERFTVRELLQPLLLASSNVAAEALLSTIDRTHFLELMSSYSWEIGMPSTFFADPSGVSPYNVASAKDLFALAQYLYTSRPDILEITRSTGTEIATTSQHGFHAFSSTHPFASDPRFIGGKTGRTPEAGDTMLTILRIKNQAVAIVVLGSRYEGRAADTRLLAAKVESLLSGE